MPHADASAHHTQRPGRNLLGLVGILSEGFFSHLSSGVVAFALPLYARELGSVSPRSASSSRCTSASLWL